MSNPFYHLSVSNALTMVMFTKKIIDGVIKFVQHIRYANGTEVQRVYAPGCNVPEDVIFIKPTK